MDTRKARRVGLEKEKVLRAMSALGFAIMDLQNALDDSDYRISDDLDALSQKSYQVLSSRNEKPIVVKK
jgi:hypothetical protein